MQRRCRAARTPCRSASCSSSKLSSHGRPPAAVCCLCSARPRQRSLLLVIQLQSSQRVRIRNIRLCFILHLLSCRSWLPRCGIFDATRSLLCSVRISAKDIRKNTLKAPNSACLRRPTRSLCRPGWLPVQASVAPPRISIEDRERTKSFPTAERSVEPILRVSGQSKHTPMFECSSQSGCL